MPSHAPWMQPVWLDATAATIEVELATVGRAPCGPIETVRAWGRSCLRTVPTGGGTVWIKHGYGLSPGEERVLAAIQPRWPDRLPGVVATWPGTLAMEALAGRELQPTDSVADWAVVAAALGEMLAGEREHVADWLAMGVRDRRPPRWEPAVRSLLASPVLDDLDSEIRGEFEDKLPDHVTRYEQGSQTFPTLVPQDSGSCNIHLSEEGPLFFDWADVVVGHPAFSCDRLLDQAPETHREAVIEAFCEPLELTRAEFDAMRRSNVLHEVLRHHDELEHLAEHDEARVSLPRSVRSQLRVLVEHERKRR